MLAAERAAELLVSRLLRQLDQHLNFTEPDVVGCGHFPPSEPNGARTDDRGPIHVDEILTDMARKQAFCVEGIVP
jgi:hypothetical protein